MIGETISHYRVIGKLGVGGMGIVYEGEDLRLARRVALKFLPDELAVSGMAAKRRAGKSRIATNHHFQPTRQSRKRFRNMIIASLPRVSRVINTETKMKPQPRVSPTANGILNGRTPEFERSNVQV